MASPVTEVAILPLKPGVDFKDASSDSSKILQDSLKIIQARPGFQRLSWGTQIEAPDTLNLLIDWDTLQAHNDFRQSPDYADFVTNFRTILTGAPTIFHVQLSAPSTPPPSTPSTKTNTPITENLFLYFPLSYTPEQQKQFLTDLDAAVAQMDTPLLKSLARGFQVAEEKEGTSYEGVKDGSGKALVCVVLFGWETVEAHMEARKAPNFAGAAKVFAPAEGKQMKHVAYTRL